MVRIFPDAPHPTDADINSENYHYIYILIIFFQIVNEQLPPAPGASITLKMVYYIQGRKMETLQTQKEDTSLEAIQAILRNVAKQQEETARQMKETNKKISELGGRFGEMVEYMVMPNLLAKFAELGFEFETAYHSKVIKDTKNKIFTEVDITLENGDKVMIVEVKTKPTIDDIKYHLERMVKVRAYADLHNDKRKFLGAIAGMVINDNEREFALKSGFYLIEPSGETFIITVPEGEYSTREW
jgi:hypothetical protein